MKQLFKLGFPLTVAFGLLFYTYAETANDKAKPQKIGWFEPVVQEIEGWKVHVDPALLEGEHKKDGELALKMLANHLQRISILIPEKQLAKMKTLGIWIEWSHPELTSMQYHPGKDWLEQKGYDPRLEKMVHIPQAKAIYSRSQMLKHPAVILHELAHSYHDQILSFDHAGILDAYKAAMEKGNYQKVMLFDGREVIHYATTNHKEYFAEATEAFLYRNDFYPFVAGELKVHDPKAYELLQTIWGE